MEAVFLKKFGKHIKKSLKEEPLHQETRAAYTAERFYPDPSMGLSSHQVQQRMSQGLSNEEQGVKTKTEKQILFDNIFTFFNILNFLLAILVILVGSYSNILFLGLIFWNIIIGCFQEIRSKRIIDKLSLISAPKANVIREGRAVKVSVSEIVLDDIMVLNSGNQVCSDSVVADGQVEVNESLITGEADPILKSPGDSLLSGSFIVSGSCRCRVEHVGADNYAQKITGSAKYVKKRNSEIMDSIDFIIKCIGFGIVPIGMLLFWKQYFVLEAGIQASVVKTVAALVGMIPEGLVLLTSVVFAVSVVRLSAHKTLVQDLYCVETLARVDTLCLDKTGTITEGSMQVDELVAFEGYNQTEMKAVLAALTANLNDENPTFMAVQEYSRDQKSGWQADDIVPFSSARKWSGAYFAGKGSYVMGAGEFILGSRFSEISSQTEIYAKNGQRVLLLAYSPQPFAGKELSGEIYCIGLVAISDKIRREAPRTLRYFADQGVDLKVISGDNPITVSNIAKRAGLEDADKYIDATTLESDEEIESAILNYSVFGRVTPDQKLAFVKALKKNNHTVAMTGDGVNDVLALKEADCSIAMASGSDAARTVSSLVLLDSNFASMPLIVQEGRRSINNLQRSASLFLVKTIFSALIGVIFIFLNYAYPFQPIQLTLISSLTIGVPSFILALEPNRDRVKGKFLNNVLKMSIPAGLTMTIATVLLCALGSVAGISNEELSTLAVLTTSFVGFMMLFKVCSPFNGLRGTLFFTMTAGFLLAFMFLEELFFLTPFSLAMIMVLTFTLLFSLALMMAMLNLVDMITSRRPIKPRTGRRRKNRKTARSD